MTTEVHRKQNIEQLLAQLAAVVEAHFGDLSRFQFIPDCPYFIGDTSGGVTATAPEYQALATIAYARWLCAQAEREQREKEVLRRRKSIRQVAGRGAR